MTSSGELEQGCLCKVSAEYPEKFHNGANMWTTLYH